VQRVEIPDGEEYKSLATLEEICNRLVEQGLDRGSWLLALGGGVVGDLAGFAAAVFLRGIPFVQVPTTLLAQVDSSVGGKTGVNLAAGKNLVGAFYQPRLVVIDVATLTTLAEREFRSGLAEVVKYGMVLDRELFDFLEAQAAHLLARELECLLSVIRCSCKMKAAVVEQDEREADLRAVLNYGHTIGHAVETLTGYRQFSHGEAVAIGMVRAARCAEFQGLARQDDTARLLRLLASFGLPVEPPAFPLHDYAEALLRDKKVREGGVRFVLNRGIGAFEFTRYTDIPALLTACGMGE
jgi:3-dehydroquinate synthase